MGKIFWIITIFLVIGGYMIYSSQNTDISNPSSAFSFIGEFAGWIFHVGESTTKTATHKIPSVDPYLSKQNKLIFLEAKYAPRQKKSAASDDGA